MWPELIARVAAGVMGRLQRYHELQLSRGVLQTLVLLECKVNLALLDLLRGQKPVPEPLAGSVARALRFDAFEQLFTQPETAGEVLELLIRNVYARCMAIQEIARLANDDGVIPGVSMERRLKNLRRDVLRVVTVLS
jgi:hypothetical protein